MVARPRIAVVTANLPVPAYSAGPLRTFHLCRAVAAVADVWLYARADIDLDTLRGRPELAPYQQIRTAPRVGRGPFGWLLADDGRLAELLARDHVAHAFDAIVASTVFTTSVAAAVDGVPLVIEEHNIESEVLAMFGGEREQRVGMTAAELARRSAQAWRAADLVTTVCADDAAGVTRAGCHHVAVIPNGVTLDDPPLRLPTSRRSKEVLFVGAMFWPPNLEAAHTLAADVMPQVWADEPGARLVLCGRDPPPQLLALEHERIFVTGTVASPAPLLARAQVYANAVTRGGGTSQKTLEPLAAGVPLVSTACGVRGYPLVPGRHHLAASNPDQMATAIVDVLRSDALDGMAIAARAAVESHDWATIGRTFAAQVMALVRGG